jgi:G3E family GTPase
MTAWKARMLPLITLVAGMPAAGKSTVIRHLLATSPDGQLVCLKCTPTCTALKAMRDLPRETYDHLLIELMPFDDPDVVRESLAGAGFDREQIRVATVLSAQTLLTDFCSQDLVGDRPPHLLDDMRTVADVVTGQIESADVLLLNKSDRVDERERGGLVSLLTALAPHVPRLESRWGAVARDRLLAALFGESATRGAPNGLALAFAGAAFPEAARLDISSLVFRERRPFHPERLYQLFSETWDGVVRAGGFFWIASRPDWVGEFSQAGAARRYRAVSSWWAATLEGRNIDRKEIEQLLDIEWDPTHGDRRQELAFVGIHFDPDDLRRRLEACLLTPRELRAGRELWLTLEDPFPRWGLSMSSYRRAIHH